MLVDEEVPAGEHLQRKLAVGFFAPGPQLLVIGPVISAGQHMQRQLRAGR